jgi:shikimate kinase
MFSLAERNIVLTGFMGSGKTTVGQCLAEILSWDFFDTDELITRKVKLSINEIFTRWGEEFFRDKETEVVSCLGERAPGTCVVATGGGVVLREENRAALSKNGFIFFLDVDAAELYRRLKDKEDRPLLHVEDPPQRIEQMLTERRPFYLKADFRIEAGTRSPEEIAEEIRSFLWRKKK